ncbi:MAG: type II CRISPR RNA-guided endonuclease Cas9, partial [Coriobacteriia bacterium]|nr:type II CRISPR RNA-guided endonuclease Cas9 [Coriobacteriia bacterium]
MGLHVGLDIGIASVGWCAIDDAEKGILGAGVRTFPKAEDPKTGASLALPRRLARSARRRLRRRRIRMARLRELIVSSGMLTPEALEAAFVLDRSSKSPYELRVVGLDRRLASDEWARVLSQLCKRRGYRSMKLDDSVKDDDEGVVKEAIAANASLMRERGYRTVGEMLWRDERFAQAQRNKGDYKGVVSRDLLLEEIANLFAAQRGYDNPHATASIEAEYIGILSWQAPIKEGDALLETVGLCSIDKVNRRIPLACPTFERFRIMDKLHNVRYTLSGGGTRHNLTDDQRCVVVDKVFERVTPLTLAELRTLCGLPQDARFVGVRYGRADADDTSAEKKERLPHPKAWHAMRKAVSAASPAGWEALSS